MTLKEWGHYPKLRGHGPFFKGHGDSRYPYSNPGLWDQGVSPHFRDTSWNLSFFMVD